MPSAVRVASFAAVPFAVAASLLVALNVSEGREYVPYYDSAGVLTVCRGVTGPDVVEGRTYTPTECDVLEVRHIERMYARMGRCVPVPLTPEEAGVWGHFAYNIGEAAFCASTAARLLREGRYADACRQILAWRYIRRPTKRYMPDGTPGLTADGRHFDCSTPGNKICPGLWTRRQSEASSCLAAGG